MHTIEQVNPEDSCKIREIYEDFRNKALKDYKYGIEPVEFHDFILAIDENRLGSLVVFEKEKPTGILIYSFEKHKVIEINAIHSLYDKYENNRRFVLLENLVNELKNKNDWKAVSYAMLGKQETFVRDSALLEFKFIGQSVVKFDFQSPVSFRIFKQAQTPDIKGYSFDTWNERYKNQVIELTNAAFKNNKSINFDPRFLTREGTKDVINMIVNDLYGKFLPFQCRLILSNGNLEGFCLITMTAEDQVTIPLIATRKDSRGKGLGKILLKSVLSGFMKLIGDRKITLSEINATVDTDNYPAVRMYRRLGFKEDYFYPHAYFKNIN